jgi:hypothetical protein
MDIGHLMEQELILCISVRMLSMPTRSRVSVLVLCSISILCVQFVRHTPHSHREKASTQRTGGNPW